MKNRLRQVMGLALSAGLLGGASTPALAQTFTVSDTGKANIKLTNAAETLILVGGGGGQDIRYTYTRGAVEITDVLSGVTGNVTIDTRGGADVVIFFRLFVPDGLTLKTGGGADEVDIDFLEVADDLRIVSGGGNDIVNLNVVNVVDNTFITTGGGNDAVDGYGIGAGNRLSINTGGGNDTTLLHSGNVNGGQTIVSGRLNVSTGSGNDDVTLNYVMAEDTTSIVTVAGQDDVVLEDSMFAKRVSVNLGTTANDTLTLKSSNFNSATPDMFNGGNGNGDVFADMGSTFTEEPTILRFEVVDQPAPDGDGDGVPDSTDNCPDDANADQSDRYGSENGDACEDDSNGDGIPDVDETDICISIDGVEVLQNGDAGCSSTPTTGVSPNIAVAHGAFANAQVANGDNNTATAQGESARARASFGNNNTATAQGEDAFAATSSGDNNTATAEGVNAAADATDGDNNTATAEGEEASADAGNGNGNIATATGANADARAQDPNGCTAEAIGDGAFDQCPAT